MAPYHTSGAVHAEGGCGVGSAYWEVWGVPASICEQAHHEPYEGGHRGDAST
ncbi:MULTISPECIES: hypothetical protein [unclassified Streptomyces]|uniref:hypothetical protein n=1 Tax=unclassified Streptomyces TaxID=2593676 RepID=UPI002024AB81|nr:MULTISPECIES: hypothetical protein [unclassified Streptomyces]WSC24003.1 hypothetical protein OIE60_32425 [Streptomyces sp. NBC_01766]WSV57886.1 hypothetical protein OG282_31690 [Streptomyces sp. NBC_01014]